MPATRGPANTTLTTFLEYVTIQQIAYLPAPKSCAAVQRHNDGRQGPSKHHADHICQRHRQERLAAPVAAGARQQCSMQHVRGSGQCVLTRPGWVYSLCCQASNKATTARVAVSPCLLLQPRHNISFTYLLRPCLLQCGCYSQLQGQLPMQVQAWLAGAALKPPCCWNKYTLL